MTVQEFRSILLLMTNPFFTIGHSTRPIEDFIHLLRAGDVGLVVDVRTVPRSRWNPQYNSEALAKALAQHGIGYELMPALGGLRPASKEVDPGTNGFWENDSFRNYADYALTPQFREGLDHLIALGAKQRCAVMCAEAVWWRCHRRIIADYLLANGHEVFHLLDKDKVEPAVMTEAAQAQDGVLVYPAAVTQGALRL